MKFYGVDMQGKFQIESVATLPAWISSDERRIVYAADVKACYYGTNTGWVKLEIDVHKSDHENGGSDEISVASLSGLLADDQNPTNHASDHTDGTDDIQSATSSQKGVAELATSAETITGTDSNRVVTPAGLQSKVATTSAKGISELATSAEVTAGTDTVRTITPSAITGSNFCRIKTGTYTGDGSTGQAITGVGFTPKSIEIWVHPVGATGAEMHTKLDLTWGDYDFVHTSSDPEHHNDLSRINSLDADGFTVDDDIIDATPNKDGIVYDYRALG